MSSKRRLRQKSCSNKKAYPDKASAWNARRSTFGRKDGKQPLIYHCKFCGKWHTGHLPAKIKKIIKYKEKMRS